MHSTISTHTFLAYSDLISRSLSCLRTDLWSLLHSRQHTRTCARAHTRTHTHTLLGFATPQKTPKTIIKKKRAENVSSSLPCASLQGHWNSTEPSWLIFTHSLTWREEGKGGGGVKWDEIRREEKEWDSCLLLHTSAFHNLPLQQKLTRKTKTDEKDLFLKLFLVVISLAAVQNFQVLVFDILMQLQHHWLFFSCLATVLKGLWQTERRTWTQKKAHTTVEKFAETIWMEYVFSAQQPGWNQRLSRLRPRNVLQRFALTTSNSWTQNRFYTSSSLFWEGEVLTNPLNSVCFLFFPLLLFIFYFLFCSLSKTLEANLTLPFLLKVCGWKWKPLCCLATSAFPS